MLHMLYFIAAVTGLVQQDWAWRVFPEAGFKVLSPVMLEHSVTQIPTDVDMVDYHQYHGGSVSDSALAMTFVIDHYTLSTDIEAMEEADLRDFFGNTIDPILIVVEGTLVYMDIQRKAGVDICSWKASYRNEEGVIRGEAMLTENKYYGLQVFGWTRHKPETQMNKFFSSFAMTDK